MIFGPCLAHPLGLDSIFVVSREEQQKHRVISVNNTQLWSLFSLGLKSQNICALRTEFGLKSNAWNTAWSREEVMSSDSVSEDLLKSLAVLSLEGTCSMLESSLQCWNVLTLWMVKIVLFSLVDIHILACFQGLHDPLLKEEYLSFGKTNWKFQLVQN